MSSEGPESTDIDSEQAQQKSACILMYRGHPCQQILVWSVPMFLIIHVLTPTIHVLWQITDRSIFMKQNSSIIPQGLSIKA